MSKQKGWVLIFTGDGKGKTSAAMGTALRMLSHGGNVAMVQFMKGMKSAEEERLAKKFGSQFQVWNFGGGFTWETSREENTKAVRSAWKKCVRLLRSSRFSLLIFDEIHVAIQYRFLKTKEVVAALKLRHPAQDVVLTGRNAPSALIRTADLVTEMKCRKHPFAKGSLAKTGIDF